MDKINAESSTKTRDFELFYL